MVKKTVAKHCSYLFGTEKEQEGIYLAEYRLPSGADLYLPFRSDMIGCMSFNVSDLISSNVS